MLPQGWFWVVSVFLKLSYKVRFLKIYEYEILYDSIFIFIFVYILAK